MTSQVAVAPRWDEEIVATTPRQRFRLGGGWWTLLLALAVLLSMGGALYATGWSEGLDLVQMAILAGALLGALLALTRWSGAFSALYSFLASIVVIVSLLNSGFFPDASLHDAVAAIVQRNVSWFAALFNRAPAADNLIFVIQLCLLGWWIGHFAIWSLFRHQQVMHAVIPAGIGVLVIVYYSPLNLTGYLIVYLMSVLLLSISVELARNQARWQVFHIRYAPDIFWDFLKAGLVFVVLVTAMAWLAPSGLGRATMERLSRPFDATWHRVEETWSRMYSSLHYQGPAVRTTKFGKSMSLGGPVQLTDRPIFNVDVGRRSYWRGAVFDLYTGQSWQNTDDDLIIIERNVPIGEPQITLYGEITATIVPLEPEQDVIFGAPQPLRVSVPTNAEASRIVGGNALHVSLLRSRVPFGRDGYYQVTSAVSVAPQEVLRKAGAAYPQWVRDRYLQVPGEFPERVRQLAQSVTAKSENAYDKASAIEEYLRGYDYNQSIEAPPPDVDAVEHFLFTSKEGYCDYYASAMTMMLRSVGVPARFVVGYTPGELIQTEDMLQMGIQSQSYQVLERNAHAWPEVYFPEYGWIQFEPTASEPLLVRPVPVQATPSPTPSGATGGDMGNQDEDLLPDRLGDVPQGAVQLDPPAIRWLRANWLKLLAGILGAAIIAGAALAVHWRRQTFFRSPELLVRLFDVLGSWATRLRIQWFDSQTPLERAAAFNQQVPEAEPAVDRLAGLFVAQRYGRLQPSPDTVSVLVDDWVRLEPSLWKHWLSRVARSVRATAQRKSD